MALALVEQLAKVLDLVYLLILAKQLAKNTDRSTRNPTLGLSLVY